MRAICLVPLVLVLGCSAPNPQDGAGGNGSDGGAGSDGSTGGGGGGGGGVNGGGGGLMTFAVFGDSRPPNPNDTAGYPSTIIGGIFTQAQAKGAQFVVGTGDYMFASNQSTVDAQVSLFLQAQSNFKGPVYHTMGNHECTGYTASNCPLGTETPNVRAFMSKFVPSGVTTPYYRVDVSTPMGKAKFLFVAANAWSMAQENWLTQQLAEKTTYTFVVRHEPGYDTQAPGVGPSEAAMQGASYTMALLGHTHSFRKLSVNTVISGNGGAPLGGGGSYGFLLVEQQADGNLLVSEIEEASGNALESWKVTPGGTAAN